MVNNGSWLSVIEYANAKAVSISTVRRYIKAKRVKYKNEGGKFYIFFKPNKINTKKVNSEIIKLKIEKAQLEEEINNLKMLINVYERKLNINLEPPPLPEVL